MNNFIVQKNENVSEKKKSILILFPHNPLLRQNGVQARFYALLCYFRSRNYQIDILSHVNFVDKWDYEHRRSGLIDNVYLNDFKFSRAHDERVKSPLSDYGSDELKQQFIDLCEKNNYSFVLVSYVHWAKIIKNIKLRAETILTIEDFISLNKFDRLGDEYNLGASINEEIERVRLFDKAICISREEMNFFERVCKRTKFYYVPHFSEEREIKNEKKEFDLLFVGSDNPFNVRGMSWFFDNVYTRLADNLKIAVIGGVNKELLAYRSKFKNVMFADFVQDLDAMYQKSKIVICPLKGGTGLKVKVVEAMSFGLPIVTTKYGLLSIDGANNGCLRADAPQDFASAIERLISDDGIYTELSKSAFDYFRNNFSRDIAYKRLDEVFVR